MAFHKKEGFGKKEQELAEVAKALSHPARIDILKVLAQKNQCRFQTIGNYQSKSNCSREGVGL
jgi:DNA-binding transcriptional ArsR family regulator